jgi:hypothetical protein
MLVFDANLVFLVCENPRYTKMSPKEALGKFVSHQMMVKDSKYIDDVTNGSLLSTELQVIAFKVSNDKEVLPSKVEQNEATNFHDEDMALVIKRFKNALKWRKEYSNKNKSKGKCVCFKCSKTSNFIANFPDNDDHEKDTKGKKVEKKKFYKKKNVKVLIGKEWDSDSSFSDFDDKGLATIAFDKSFLFPNE